MNALLASVAALAPPLAQRIMLAIAVLAAYALFCALIFRRHRDAHAHAHAAPADADTDAASPAATILIAFASQTGMSEQLAHQTGDVLRRAGAQVDILPLADIDGSALLRARTALFIVSTYGDGAAPDDAVRFESRWMDGQPLALPDLRFAVLALGDRSYADFCAFGRRLDAWLARSGAQPMFDRVDVDDGDASDLAQWRHEIARLAGTNDLPEWQAPQFEAWRLAARQLLNPGSAGEPMFMVTLEPPSGLLPSWRSGDLVQVLPPSDTRKSREYSIASIPEDGRLHLLVRQTRRPDGSLGHASGWLTRDAALGDKVSLRIRQHPNFRLGANMDRPLILIGNGSGMAGLLGHLKARAAAGKRRNWLVFGERHASHDSYCKDDIDALRRHGSLARCDLVFSRDQAQRLYVQDVLRQEAEAVREWIRSGAAVYVCGSLRGMAAGVDAVLQEILGKPALIRLGEQGRYRRDVY